MYIPPHFAETRPEELHRILRAHPLGMLCTAGPQGLDANHLPFHLDPDAGPHGTLIAHVARANPLWQAVPSGSEVLVVFRGGEGYISPNWYPSKHEAHRAVPTWNYEVVHAHGTLTIHDDEKHVRGVVARLTHTHEGHAHQAGGYRPWKMGDAPPDFLDQMLRAIVGIEVRITRLEGKRKLGQNREPRDREGTIAALDARGQAPLVQAMRRADGELR
ncbi:MAG: FMN-binding negative transcriptional regulator [Acidovorax sp.]|nr:FMN-binding negative transcriptional regulator [Acidovorax sp.]